MLEFIEHQLEKANLNKQKRILIESYRESESFFIDNKKAIDFSSNDYLNLSTHPFLIKKTIVYTNKYGVGSTGSRLISGTLPITTEIEKKLAKFKKTESSLLFNSGFQANVSVLPSLCSKNSLILMDKFCHNSLIQGALLSKAKILRYKHNDLSQLEKLLQNSSTKSFDRIFIVTESIFGMDGDILDIDKLCFLAKKYHALIYLDEAHSTGILGKNGQGLSVDKDIFITLGTFGKAFGSFGAFISCSKKVKDYLINYCSGLIFTTALPPSLLGAIDAALDIIPSLEKERKHLFEVASKFRNDLISQGFITTKTDSHIVPLITKSEELSLSLYEYLLNHGIYSIAIRPPTVPKNMSRIRFAMSAKIEDEDIQLVLNLLKKYPQKLSLCQK